MIRYYCQYSYGGFKTFRIEGIADEPLTQVVTNNNDLEFPDIADFYFNKGSFKLLYRYLDYDTLSLIVKEIPSNGTDTDNRPISCAIQFIGDAKDREVLDRLTIRIANDIHSFEKSFANMFYLRGGLHFEGDKLDAFVKECQEEYQYKGQSELLRLRNLEGVVLLFVPFSDNFGIDNKATDKILSELQLPNEACQEQRFIRLSKLETIQYLVRADKTKDANNSDDSVCDDNGLTTISVEENDHLRELALNARLELESANKELASFKKTTTLLILIYSLLLFVLIVSNCKTTSEIITGVVLIIMSIITYRLFKQ